MIPKMKIERGITLIQLVITIILILIIAAIVLLSLRKWNILIYAEDITKEYNQVAKNELDTLKGYDDYLDKNVNGLGDDDNGDGSGTGSGDDTEEDNRVRISKSESFVGYYADIDDDGDVDGIIFADLAFSKKEQWFDVDGTYSYEKKDTLDDYTIRDAKETEKVFKGAKNKVIIPINKNEKNDRFYVMSLNDFKGGTYSTFYWYYKAYGKMTTSDTKVGFGTGKENTNKMIEIWNKNGTANGYEGATQNTRDIWKYIQGDVAKGWFIPSRAEWSAFNKAFGITSGNYSEYGLNYYYWSSSQGKDGYVWYATLRNGYMNDIYVNGYNYVRLSTTF